MSDKQISLDEINADSSSEKQPVRVGPREFEIPNDWEMVTLDPNQRITHQITDGAHQSPHQSEDGEYYYATVANLSSTGIDYSSCNLISNEEYEKMVKGGCKPQKGDVLFSKDGTVGVTTVFNDDEDVVLLSSIARITPVSEVINASYLSQYLSSGLTDFQIYSLKSGTAIRRVVLVDLEKLCIFVPPLQEQRKISTVLYTVDQQIEKNKQIFEKAREVEEASKTQLFTRGYSEWELGESVRWRCRANQFPKDWRVKPAEKLMEITRGASPRPRSDDSLFGGDIPWIKIGDAERGISKRIEEVDSYVTEKGKQKSKFVEEGTLLVTNSGATCGFSVFAGVDGCVHDGWLILKEYDGLVPDFLYHYINWNYNYLQSLSLGSAQTNLNTSLFGRLDIPLPPVQEQRQIVEAIDSINRVASHASKEIERLKRIKRGLMQDLLSGKVRTTDTNITVPDEVAQHG